MLLSLTSCGFFDIFDVFTSHHTFDGTLTSVTRAGKSEILASDVERQIYAYYGYETPTMPSTGDVTALVLPIEFSDYPFDSSGLRDLEAVFNDQNPLYFESVSSFYNKSSFGALNLSFEVAEPYSVSQASTDFLPAYVDEETSTTRVESLCRRALNAYRQTHDTTKFDSNADGYLDSVYFIYSSPDYASAMENINHSFWAYCTVAFGEEANYTEPALSRYFWASSYFMYENWEGRYASSYRDGMVDAHTYIHETGHLLGLDDYYNYDEMTGDEDYDCGSPMAGLDMMDYNIGDHTAYSKYALGWIDPKIIDDRYSFPISFSLESAPLTGDAVIIPSLNGFNGSAFGEYLMIEYLTSDGLATTDASVNYAGAYPLYYSSNGIRITHVDSRLVALEPASDGFYYEYVDATRDMLEKSTRNHFYRVAASNSPSKGLVDPDHKLITTISSMSDVDDSKVFDRVNNSANSSDLFHEGDTFTLGQYYQNFEYNPITRRYTLNDGTDFPYSITVESISEDRAVLTVDIVNG